MNNAFAIRLNHMPGYEELFEHAFTERFEKVLGVVHTGKRKRNLHYHFIVETDYAIQALRKYLNGIFTKGKGNGHLSIKNFDGERKGYAYMFHEHERETFRICMNRGHTESELEGYQAMHIRTIEDIKKNSPTEICYLMAKQIMENEKKCYWHEHSVIFTYITNHCRSKGEWYPNKFQYDRWIMMIQSLMDNDMTEFQKTIEHWYWKMYPSTPYQENKYIKPPGK